MRITSPASQARALMRERVAYAERRIEQLTEQRNNMTMHEQWEQRAQISRNIAAYEKTIEILRAIAP